MLQPNPMSLSCSNKTSARCIRSRNQTGCVFDMSFLSYRCFSGSWREGSAWVRLAAAFKCAMLIILPLCLRIHLCKHYANVFFGLSLVSNRALQVWREVTDAALMWSCSFCRSGFWEQSSALDICHWLKRVAGVWKVSPVLSGVAFQENAS